MSAIATPATHTAIARASTNRMEFPPWNRPFTRRENAVGKGRTEGESVTSSAAPATTRRG